jgi:ATP-dependent DNA helicase RecQ
MSKALEILNTYWKYNAFRPLQEDIIDHVLAGRDTLALLPTGGGKSICFQVPGLIFEGVCIVISPLIALMKDQVEQLKRRGINAGAIYSGMSKREIDILLDNAIYGQVKFLYVSPERVQTELFQVRLEKMTVGLFAIDEAHCISQWGYDFRPPYLQLTLLRELKPEVPFLALTASATPEVREDIMDKLAFRERKVFQKSFARANLSYSVLYEEAKEKRLLGILEKVPGTSVVYVRSRKRTQDVAKILLKAGISADYYHAGLNPEDRSRKQEEWISGKKRVIVATNAFGMGIDKPDVRTVVHLDLPDSLEAYYQEAGRAGRDEQNAFAVVLFNQSDLEDLQARVEQQYPEIAFLKKVYQALANYFKLAVGSGWMISFDLEIEAFAKTFNLPQLETYYAIKKLEDAGVIQLNESFFQPSKVFFPVDNKVVYEYLIANRKMEPLIKIMLRMYGGELYSEYKKISESQIAKELMTDSFQVIKSLEFLHQQGIIDYQARKEKPQIIYTMPRMDPENLPLNKQAYLARKENFATKINSICHYINHQHKCRTRLILAYFGEKTKENCGMCDYCLKNKQQTKWQEANKGLSEEILKFIAIKPVWPHELVRHFSASREKLVIEAMHRLLEEELIIYAEKGKVAVSE